MNFNEAMQMLGTKLQGKYGHLGFKYKKSDKTLTRHSKNFTYMIAFSSFGGNTKDTILGWADTEGYPVDGTVDSDGQYSKADIPEHTQYDTQSLAKFAFSMFWRAMRFAEEQQVPILLDY